MVVRADIYFLNLMAHVSDDEVQDIALDMGRLVNQLSEVIVGDKVAELLRRVGCRRKGIPLYVW